MPLEIDHVFIACTFNAPEADELLRHGFKEGSRNRHQGQGTANRRFFFENFMLELIWIENKEEATSQLTRRTRLWDRLSKKDGNKNPFGIVFRPFGKELTTAPFPTWVYKPNYLPDGYAIQIADQVTLAEPELIVLPFHRQEKVAPETLMHALPLHRVIGVSVGFPNANELSITSRSVVDSKLVTYVNSSEFFLEIIFEGNEGLFVDARPSLPLILRQRLKE